ncbi:hypothetical protein [Marinifilum sp. D737]|uniref:hypothetical protein n=1 Tax=Marinifilum sp. D737 TaxID=2969628 RepID=UPI0022740939|nr:hypothetical protein [Marinifilum sp. D737]MCY1636014.1 hypothetical protein [Marinifilum sp. D737]
MHKSLILPASFNHREHREHRDGSILLTTENTGIHRVKNNHIKLPFNIFENHINSVVLTTFNAHNSTLN